MGDVTVTFTQQEAREVLKIVQDLDRQGIPGVTGLDIHGALKKLQAAYEGMLLDGIPR